MPLVIRGITVRNVVFKNENNTFCKFSRIIAVHCHVNQHVNCKISTFLCRARSEFVFTKISLGLVEGLEF